jgi:DNA-binding MarR family transcriptional regulator
LGLLAGFLFWENFTKMAFQSLNEFYNEVEERKYRRTEGFYCVIPVYVLQNPDISAEAKILYGELSALINKYGYCYATNKYLAERLGRTTRTIQYALSELKNKKLIRIEIEKDNTGTRRKIWLTIAD